MKSKNWQGCFFGFYFTSNGKIKKIMLYFFAGILVNVGADECSALDIFFV